MREEGPIVSMYTERDRKIVIIEEVKLVLHNIIGKQIIPSTYPIKSFIKSFCKNWPYEYRIFAQKNRGVAVLLQAQCYHNSYKKPLPLAKKLSRNNNLVNN